MGARKDRASRANIFNRLERLLGPDAQAVIAQVVTFLDGGEIDSAVATLKGFDAKIGGMGMPDIMGKPPGIYRPLGYIEYSLRSHYPREQARFIIDAACAHVENLLQRMTILGVFARVADNSIPMGELVRRVQKRLPSQLYQDLKWLASEVYNFSKHNFDVSKRPSPESRAHFFDLDEALAVYLIARAVAAELEALSGKTRDELMRE